VSRITFISLFCLIGLTVAASADNWPTWRGPTRDGISKETGLPVEWSEKKNIAWKLPKLGKSGSTPVVWGDRIFFTNPTGPKTGGQMMLMSLSTAGHVLWEKPLGATGHPHLKPDEPNESGSNPSTDGKHVIALVSSGDLCCYDFDGNKIWDCNIEDRYGAFQIEHGIHTSPLLYEDRLYLALLHRKAHWIVCLDKNTGKEIWKVPRPTNAELESREAYTTPIIWPLAGEKQLVIVGSDYITGHSLADGSEIWRVGDLNPKSNYKTDFRIIATPVATPDMLLVGTVRDNGPIIALKPGLRGTLSAGNPFELWRAKGAPDVASPLLVDGYAYFMHAARGDLLVLDAKTGKEAYKQNISNTNYRASPVYADGKVYLTGRGDGNVTVVKAGPKFERLAVNHLDDNFAASPVIADGRIYLRGYNNLYAIQKTDN